MSCFFIINHIKFILNVLSLYSEVELTIKQFKKQAYKYPSIFNSASQGIELWGNILDKEHLWDHPQVYKEEKRQWLHICNRTHKSKYISTTYIIDLLYKENYSFQWINSNFSVILFNDGHVLQLRPEIVAIHRWMRMVWIIMIAKWYPGTNVS